MGQITTPSTQTLRELQKGLLPKGNIAKSIEAAFMKGDISGKQATDLKNDLAHVFEYCQETQKIIISLQAEISAAKQTQILFNEVPK